MSLAFALPEPGIGRLVGSSIASGAGVGVVSYYANSFSILIVQYRV